MPRENEKVPDNDEQQKQRSLPHDKDGKIDRYNGQTETKENWRSNGRDPA